LRCIVCIFLKKKARLLRGGLFNWRILRNYCAGATVESTFAVVSAGVVSTGVVVSVAAGVAVSDVAVVSVVVCELQAVSKLKRIAE